MRTNDERTDKYLEAVKERIGYVGSNVGYKGFTERLKEDGIEEYRESKIQLGNMIRPLTGKQFAYNYNGALRYAIEYVEQTAIDDFEVVSHIFSKPAGAKEVRLIDNIMSIEMDVVGRFVNPCFRCYECGHESHWLDLDGDVKEKWEQRKEQYCGC